MFSIKTAIKALYVLLLSFLLQVSKLLSSAISKYSSLKSLAFLNFSITISVTSLADLVLNNSYENKRYLTKISRKMGKEKIRYFIKYKLVFKLFTLSLCFINLLKKLLLFRY